jgi:hypothetical protein
LGLLALSLAGGITACLVVNLRGGRENENADNLLRGKTEA